MLLKRPCRVLGLSSGKRGHPHSVPVPRFLHSPSERLSPEDFSLSVNVAGEISSDEKAIAALMWSSVDGRKSHRARIVSRKLTRLGIELEQLNVWGILVGSRDSSEISGFLKEEWQVKAGD